MTDQVYKGFLPPLVPLGQAPTSAEVSATIAAPTLQAAPTEVLATAPERKIAVVVDDEVALLRLKVKVLKALGYHTIIEFLDGAPAFDYFNSGGKADLLITDHNMSVMHGLELLHKLSAKNILPERVIMNSANDEARAGASALGAEVLGKPTGITELKDMIAAIEAKSAVPAR